MSTTKASPKAAGTNGNGQPTAHDPLTEAILYEQEIADIAAGIRGESAGLTPALFLELLPLLRRPIPKGFIQTTPPTKGKPYESTGIKSLQVQIDRLDNVLTPLNWSWHTDWSDDGRTADVEVRVLVGDQVITRRARGGVNQASTEGNLLKGSETNAAKLAFARLGVGHEVYIGATDFDPDVDPDAAEVQGKDTPAPQLQRIDGERVAELLDRAKNWVSDTQDEEEQKARNRRLATALGSVGGSGKTISERIASLTPKQADEFATLLDAEIGGEAK